MIENEKRELGRICLTITLAVLERGTETIIGGLEDITPKGVRLLCNDELKANNIYELVIEMPAEFEAKDQIIFAARCVWCRIDDTINLYHAGLQFENTDAESERIIGQLIETYGAGG